MSAPVGVGTRCPGTRGARRIAAVLLALAAAGVFGCADGPAGPIEPQPEASIAASAGEVSGAVRVMVANTDHAALMALYGATNGDAWTNNDNWGSAAPLAHWYGIETDSAGRVTGLDLSGNNLVGRIPAELGDLANLRDLELRFNQLDGSIPPRLGDLSELRVLSLDGNDLAGSIPTEFGNLTDLEYLGLRSNRLTGRIPPELGQLSRLEDLTLSDNALTGRIPRELGQLSELGLLWLSHNELTGRFPPELGSLSNLRILWLSHNELAGTVPAELGGLGSLDWLLVGDNPLGGPLPLSLKGLSLEIFGFDNTYLCVPADPSFRAWLNSISIHQGSGLDCASGTTDRDILTAFYNATGGPQWSNNRNWLSDGSIGEWHGVTTDADGRVTQLHLTGNNLTGTIPAALGGLSNLEWLWLGSNSLTGAIPPELGDLSNLQRLSLRSNSLTGVIPPALGDLSNLRELSLDSNGLTGAIPLEFGSLANLENLGLYSNSLTGVIPPELGGLRSLRLLRLEDNPLAGPLPLELKGLPLVLFYYNSTDLCVPADESFRAWLNSIPDHRGTGAECTAGNTDRDILVAFYNATGGPQWSNNRNWLSDGPIGEWHGVTTDSDGLVIELWLGDNNLAGSIPPELGGLSNLERIHLSSNSLTGVIPPELGELPNLAWLQLGANDLTGSIPPELGGLSNLEVLYIGGNDVSGAIPPELGSLSDLEVLHLNDNRLTGAIPPQIGRLSSLQTLDLSENRLSSLPSGVFSGLSSLRNLLLQENELASLPSGIFSGLFNLERLWLFGNPGAPFRLSLRFERTDDVLTAPSPAQVRLALAEGAPFAMEIPLSIDGGSSASSSASLPAGSSEGPPVSVTQASTGQPARVGAASVPEYDTFAFQGIDFALPDTLVLFESAGGHSCARGAETPLAMGNSVAGVLAGGDEHCFAIRVPTGATAGRVTAWTEGGIDTYGILYDDRYEIVDEQDDLGGGNYNFQVSAQGGPGTYYVKVRGFDDTTTGAYLLKADDHGGSLDTATPWSLLSGWMERGDTAVVSGDLTVPDNEDYFHVPVSGTPNVVAVYLNFGTAGSTDTYGVLYDSAGTVIARDDDSGPVRNFHIFRELAPGDYYVAVSGYGGTTTGSYELRVWFPAASTDRDILVALYNATGGTNWTNNTNWLSDRPIGEWHGVTTDSDGRVTQLYLTANNLTGAIPAALGGLSNLRHLELTNNNFTGAIPPELGGLSRLITLGAARSNLSGAIPPQLGGLASLEDLFLESNNLTGSLPAELGNLASLRSLYLAGNNLTGAIPEELGNLAGLRLLDLASNDLTRAIPAELGGLANLTTLWLSDNNLTGGIPPALGSLANLTYLFVYDNPLSGPLPLELNGLPLESLHYHRTDLCVPTDGSFRAWLDAIRDHRGTGVDCTATSSDRDILVALYNATGGTNWSNNSNWVSDRPIGEWHGVTTDSDGRVAELWLGDNNLTGSIPPELGDLSNLGQLSLQFNSLTGAIPSELGSLANLELLLLDSNNLTGSIPPELGNLSNLGQLWLGSNSLTGAIPPELGDLSTLGELSLEYNNLSGTVPPELGNLFNLEVLHLSENHLTGDVPAELGDIGSTLKYLLLNGNELTGEVPSAWTDLDSLDEFWWDDNDEDDPLCVPEGDDWDGWLAAIETDGGPRCSSAGAPDLVVSSVDPTEMTLVAGGSAETVAFTILNAGDGAADSTTATIRVSADATITTDDAAIGDTLAVPGLAASDSTALGITLNVSAGVPDQVVYVGMCVEPVSGESDADNNCSSAVTLNIVSSAAADFKGRDDGSPARLLVVTAVPEIPESVGGR